MEVMDLRANDPFLQFRVQSSMVHSSNGSFKKLMYLSPTFFESNTPPRATT
jgi:hypothetical protein